MRHSAYATYTKEIFGKTTAPSDVSNFKMVAQGDQAYLYWDGVTDLDVVHGGNYWIRYTSKTSGATWASSTDITKTIPGSSKEYSVPLMSGTYLIKALDSSSNESGTAALVISNVADILNLNAVYNTTQHSSFGSDTVDKGVNDTNTNNIKYDTSSQVIQLLASSAASGTHDPYLISSANEFISNYWIDTAPGNIDSRAGNLDDSPHTVNKLEDDNASFTSSLLGYEIVNVTDSTSTTISAVDSATRLTLASDIFNGVDGDEYRIQVADNKLRDTGASFTSAVLSKIIRNTDNDTIASISSVDDANNLTLSANIFDQTDGANYIIEGDISSLGYYYFTDQSIDLGQVYNSRITSSYSSTSFSTADLFDSSSGLFDSKSGKFDGADISDTNAELEIRTTTDNPSSSPTWSSWGKFFVGDYYARGIQFRMKLSSSDTTHNVKVDSLSVSIDMPDTIKRGYSVLSDSGTNNGTKTITYATSFKTTPTVGITMQDSDTGDYFSITSNSNTGFTITFYNSSSIATQKTFNWISSGY